MRIYSGQITDLNPNQIIVFGSNTQGKHGKGAALWAFRNAGAEYGQARGLMGQSYGIITKDLTIAKIPNIEPEKIKIQIRTLYNLARIMPQWEFLVAYSEGPYLNGYSPRDMAEMFSCEKPPENIVFEENFAKLIK